MGRAKGVVVAFRPLGEPAEAARLTQGQHPVAPAGQYLVGIALVADIPDQLVPWRVKDRVDRHGQFHHAQA